MDLMTLAAKLTLDDSGFQSGINQAESSGKKLTEKMSAMTVAVGNIMSNLITKGYQAVTGVIGSATEAYANYEQLVGGVDTLFKTSSEKVQQYAKNAYKTAGLSANEYMETVTGFSASLIQGLKGDTEEAAELADMAITDMSDNANKMGTDISSIQTAYQGFAKQNYTMLDNLKLGYGGTADEMLRLVNDSGILDTEIESLDDITFDQLVLAIHAIQTELGITGTTAAEAKETIAGSKGSLKSAWADLLSAVGGEGDKARLNETMENFKTSFTDYMENFLPTLVTTIVNSGSLVTGIAEAVSSLPTDLLSTIMEAGVESGTEMIGGLDTLVNWIIDSLVVLFTNASIDSSKVTSFGEAIGKFLGNTVSNLISNVPALLEGMVTVGISLAGGIITGIWEGLFGTGENDKLKEIKDGLEETLVGAEVSSNKAQAILKYMQSLKEKYGDAVTETVQWKEAENQLEDVLGGSKEVFEEYGDNVQGAIDRLSEMAEELRKLAIQQAMQEALEAEYKLLGEYETQKYRAEARIEMAEGGITQNETDLAESAKAYAKFLLKNNALEQGTEEWYTAQSTLNEEGYAGTGISKLIEAMEGYYERNKTPESEMIWNESKEDNILDPETIQGLETANAEYRAEIDAATEDVKDAQQGIDDTTQAIAEMEAAIVLASDDIKAMGSSASTAAANLQTVHVTTTNDNGTNVDDQVGYSEKAIGLDYAATDGIKVSLHKGEAVLTREENENRLYGNYNTSDIQAALEEAIESAMGRMSVNMSGERVGDVTTQRVSSNISSNDRTRMVALGGW